MSNRDDLRTRLEAMLRSAPITQAYREKGVNYAVALDLLQRIEEMEATLRTLRGGIFADANAVNAFIDAALKGGQP